MTSLRTLFAIGTVALLSTGAFLVPLFACSMRGTVAADRCCCDHGAGKASPIPAVTRKDCCTRIETPEASPVIADASGPRVATPVPTSIAALLDLAPPSTPRTASPVGPHGPPPPAPPLLRASPSLLI